MYQLLSSNETVKSGGISIRIEKFLGGGTQGEVYRSELSENPVAVKWYFPQYLRSDTGLRSRLERAVKDGAPDNRFLWPMSIVTSETRPGFGYVMGLRSPNYQRWLWTPVPISVAVSWVLRVPYSTFSIYH